MINKERFEREFRQISKFGALSDGGLTRLAFSKEECEAREYLYELFKAADLKVRVDSVGNIYAKFDDEKFITKPSAPAVSVGSHIDSVPFGGFYDGTLGVMAGLEAVRSIKELGITLKRPLELIVFACEESSRFKMATIGSKIISGKLGLNKLHELKDDSDISLFDAMKNFGLEPQNLNSAILQKGAYHSYLELHIEQGPVLERLNIAVGVVTGIAAPIRYELVIKGRADHSGATPMNMRNDALVAASYIIIAAEKFAIAKSTAVATIGYAKTKPGVLNVVPGEVVLGVDIRDIDKDELSALDKELRQFVANLSREMKFSYKITELIRDTPVKLSQKAINLLTNEAQNLGIKTINLPSGAGHDAMNMLSLADSVGMLFIPCKDGISHNINESINFDDAFKATEILTAAMIKLANE
ncbi:Zn-dependent hydrolase [Campylobacter sp. faydin G-24]|uniref:Zn-dependent hydrolase n=1 Tax=Campylobacter anatolicus TaxID=2829105 RepID=A0ABS5HJ21_9BACT|nr:Zn-dependent hydrolase [Campylobacter anatolicus]MBR8464256.1 Zn-dependent hydrolase [Campylobacter anatolicus]MBR8466161.1 Zn-dependent hydrolase [Campylobacter anatolicus]